MFVSRWCGQTRGLVASPFGTRVPVSRSLKRLKVTHTHTHTNCWPSQYSFVIRSCTHSLTHSPSQACTLTSSFLNPTPALSHTPTAPTHSHALHTAPTKRTSIWIRLNMQCIKVIILHSVVFNNFLLVTAAFHHYSITNLDFSTVAQFFDCFVFLWFFEFVETWQWTSGGVRTFLKI